MDNVERGMRTREDSALFLARLIEAVEKFPNTGPALANPQAEKVAA